ncbi:MAG: penicillin acylase family protein [Sphingomonadales bacterium]|nr:penicillin acylase family protein [Sphingomonadales bacterium]
MSLPKPALAVALLLATPAAAQPYRATIVRDEWGIAHITGRTDADAVFGMITAQAEDDFPRIEDNYLTSLGRKAEAEGEGALWQDLRQRLWVDPARLRADYARSPRWLRALMDAWAAGLNHYLATHPQVRPRVLTRFEPWMALSFTEGSIGGDIEGVPLAPIAAFYGNQKIAAADTALHDPTGSNGIAIAPAHSTSGHALLLINPHTSFFFRSELQMTSGQGLNAYGAVTWGQFFIYQGFNAHAGWMHTSSGIDNVDQFAETIVQRSGRSYYARHLGRLEPVRERRLTLRYRDANGTLSSRTFTTYATRHGPIVAAANGKWIAQALMNRPLAALRQSYLRTKAHDLAQFMKVANLKANSSNNTLFADSKGEIAYLHPQFVPVRDDRLDWRAPVDGETADWHGLHALATLPQAINPRSGWAYNTNNAPWTAAGADSPRADAFPRYMDQIGANPRGPHAERLLADTPRFSLDGLITAAYDPWLPEFDRLIPRLAAAHARHPDPARDAAVALLVQWDRRWSLDSTATTLAVFWGDAMLARGKAEIAAGRQTRWQWLDVAGDDVRLAALDEALARLRADFGRWQVPWGEVNRYQRNDAAIGQRFDDAKPSTPIPFTASTWGSLAAFGAERAPGTKRYYGTRGNSFVAAVEFGPRVHARAVSIGGESGDPASPHFADQVARYAAGDLREVHFHPDEIAAHARSRETVTNR